MSEAEQGKLQRQLAARDTLRRSGLAGQRLGKHKVPEKEVDVQLGEDLSESLRALKVCLPWSDRGDFLTDSNS